MRLLQKHLHDTPTTLGVGSNRANVALSLLQNIKGLGHACEDAISIAILDDGMQVRTPLLTSRLA